VLKNIEKDKPIYKPGRKDCQSDGHGDKRRPEL
jgi:hypothetical protein